MSKKKKKKERKKEKKKKKKNRDQHSSRRRGHRHRRRDRDRPAPRRDLETRSLGARSDRSPLPCGVRPPGSQALVARVSLRTRHDDRSTGRCRSRPVARPLEGADEQRRAQLAARPGRTVRPSSRLEWELVLERAPTGAGDLRVEAQVEATGAPQRLRRGWRWPVGRGRLVRMGTFVVKDAEGRELYRGRPAAAANKVSVTVPTLRSREPPTRSRSTP